MIIYGHQEIWFSRASGNDYLIGQNRRVIEVSFGLSKNSLEAHLSKVKRRAWLLGWWLSQPGLVWKGDRYNPPNPRRVDTL